MALAGAHSSGKTPLTLPDKNVKLKAKDYQKHVLELVKAWANRCFKLNSWTCQQKSI